VDPKRISGAALTTAPPEQNVQSKKKFEVQRFEDLQKAVWKEREACARVVENSPLGSYIEDTAAEIRARE